MFRHVFTIVFLSWALSANAQHASLYWYNLQSVAPLDEADGKLALTRMKQITADSLATFTNRGDYFQLATKTPIEWEAFHSAMASAGYYIADITQRGTSHQEYVKMGLAYQEAHYLADHPELCASWPTVIVLNPEEWAALEADKQTFVLNHSNLFLVKE